MQLIRRSQQKFADLCAAHGTLRSIEAVYEAHGFDLPVGFEPSEGGMRHSVCAAAENGAHLTDSDVQQRLLRVYLDGVDDFGRRPTDVFYAPGAEPEDNLWPEVRSCGRSSATAHR